MELRADIIAGLLLILVQPLAATVCGDGTEITAAGDARQPGPGDDADLGTGYLPDRRPYFEHPAPLSAGSPAPGLLRLRDAVLPGPDRSPARQVFGDLLLAPGAPARHRGELTITPDSIRIDSTLCAYGPDTPPPASGDWIVDEAGNNVNNTTVVLNGNLKVTTGELALDNVTLVMNCTTDGQYGISVRSGGALNLTNCAVTAYSGALHYKFAVDGLMTMDRCRVSEMWGDPADWDVSGVSISSGRVEIRSSSIFDGEVLGIAAHMNSAPRISGTAVFNNSQMGMAITGSSTARLEHCTVTGNGQLGVGVSDTSAPLLSYCTSSENGRVGIQFSETARPGIDNCTVARNGWHGVVIFDNSAPAFENCDFLNNSRAGVMVCDASLPAFSACNSSGNTYCGFAIFDDSAPTLANTACLNNSMHGIQTTESAFPSISDCVASGNNWSGIAAYDSSAPSISRCTADGNTVDGLQTADAARPTVGDCRFKGNGLDGITAYVTSTPDIAGCRFDNNSRCGIRVYGTSHPVVRDCTLSGNNEFGIVAMGTSDPEFFDCAVSSGVDCGIAVSDSARPVFTNCSSTGNTGFGILLDADSTAALTNCTSTGNLGTGIAVSVSSRPVLTGCAATGNNGMGVFIAGSSAPVLENCTSNDNLDCGIWTGGSSAPVLSNCSAGNNSLMGISVMESARPVFWRCSSTGNGWDGIGVMDAASPQFSDCTSAENNGSGIQTYEFSAPVLLNCTVTRNRLPGLAVLDGSCPRVEGLYLFGNGGQNLWVTTTSPVTVANSTLSGGSTLDIQAGNSSRLTLLNTTYTKNALVAAKAQVKVQWYLAFRVLDRGNGILNGALVNGTGQNGSRLPPVASGPDGTARDIVATEYIQNGSGTEYTFFSPYDFSVARDGETNTTYGIAVQRSLSWRLYLDYSPRIGPLPDTLVTEDLPATIMLGPHLSDPDNPLSILGFTTDREYAVIDNATQVLTVNCPYHVESDVVTITVSDGLRNSSQTLLLLIIPVNDRPVCRLPIPDQEVLEDGTWALDLGDHFWDEESGRDLTYACNREEILVDNGLKQASWTPGEGNASLEAVTFTARDGYLEGASNEFNITFIPVNDPPVYLGGLADASVPERRNWTADLDDFFRDEEDQAGLIFVSSDPAVVVDQRTHVARWGPSGNSGHRIEVRFWAHDALDYSMAAVSGNVTLTYVPVNDPPVYLGMLKGARVKPGEEWNITLEDYFRDEDTEALKFSSNNVLVRIVELSRSKHCAVWRPGNYSASLTGLVFTAYDGQTYTRSDPITLDVDAAANGDQPAPVPNIIQGLPWYVYVLLPAGLMAGAAAFYAYRRVRYGKYEIERVFLVYRDGRLLAHRSKEGTAMDGEDVISGMLTALQGFIRESLRDEKRGELDEMKYGELKIAIERGERVYLAAFLSGYITDGLRAGMRDVLARVDRDFGGVLGSWDGTVNRLEGVNSILDGLVGAPAARPAGVLPAAESAPRPLPSKKMLQKVIAQMPAEPGEEVTLKSELEFFQGFVRLKVAVRNGLEVLISNAYLKLVYDPAVLRLDHVEPEYTVKGDEVVLGNVEPHEKKTVAFYLDPQICTESFLEGVLTYKDVQGNLQTLHLPRKLAAVVCPVFYTDENINTAMLKRMCAGELDKKDTKVFRLPASLEPQKAFAIGSAAVKHHDVRLVRELLEKDPFQAEGWYFGRAKGREDRMVIRVRVLGSRRVLEFFAASSSMLMLTGLLAELRNDLNRELRSEKVAGGMVQETDAAAVKAVSSEAALMDGAPDENAQ